MNGAGKSMRERSEMSLLEFCREVAGDLSHIGNWIDWDNLATGAKELVGLALALIFVALFPITIPLAGWIRMKSARKQFRQETARQARVDRLHKDEVSS